MDFPDHNRCADLAAKYRRLQAEAEEVALGYQPARTYQDKILFAESRMIATIYSWFVADLEEASSNGHGT